MTRKCIKIRLKTHITTLIKWYNFEQWTYMLMVITVVHVLGHVTVYQWQPSRLPKSRYKSLAYIFVAAYLHLNLCSGLQKTHVFCNRVRLGRSRSSKVHDSGTNRKHVCDFLFVPIVNILHRFWDTSTYWLTRNTLDCDQSNVYSSRVVFSAISQDLPFRSSSSLYRRSASGDSPLWNKFQIFVIID